MASAHDSHVGGQLMNDLMQVVRGHETMKFIFVHSLKPDAESTHTLNTYAFYCRRGFQPLANQQTLLIVAKLLDKPSLTINEFHRYTNTPAGAPKCTVPMIWMVTLPRVYVPLDPISVVREELKEMLEEEVDNDLDGHVDGLASNHISSLKRQRPRPFTVTRIGLGKRRVQ